MSFDQRQTVVGSSGRLEKFPQATGSAGLRQDQTVRLHVVHVRTEQRPEVFHGRASGNVLVLRLAETRERAAHLRDHSRKRAVQIVLRSGVRRRGESGIRRYENAGHVRENRRVVRQTEIRRDVRRGRRARFGFVDRREVQPSLDISDADILEQSARGLFREIRMRGDKKVSVRRSRSGRQRLLLRRHNDQRPDRSEDRQRIVLRRKRIL